MTHRRRVMSSSGAPRWSGCSPTTDPPIVGGAYRAAVGERRHSRTRPFRRRTNGKTERFIGTLLRTWAYARPYRSNDERLTPLPVFVERDDQSHPHTALGGLSPSAVATNVSGDHS